MVKFQIEISPGTCMIIVAVAHWQTVSYATLLRQRVVRQLVRLRSTAAKVKPRERLTVTE